MVSSLLCLLRPSFHSLWLCLSGFVVFEQVESLVVNADACWGGGKCQFDLILLHKSIMQLYIF